MKTSYKTLKGKSLVGIAALAAATGFVGAAVAADLPDVPSPQVEAPLVAPEPTAFNWTGFYIGGTVGYGFGEFDNNIPSVAGPLTNDLEDADGGVGGLVGGYNYQLDRFVFGAEADILYSGIEDDFNVGGSVPGNAELNYLGTVTGKVGFTPADKILAYVEGGYAYGKSEVSAGGASDDNFHNGFVLGAGADYAFTDNLIGGLEYNYVNLEDQDFNLGAAGVNEAGFDAHLVKGSVKFKF